MTPLDLKFTTHFTSQTPFRKTSQKSEIFPPSATKSIPGLHATFKKEALHTEIHGITFKYIGAMDMYMLFNDTYAYRL